MRKVLAEFPSPVNFCGREIGESLPFPGAAIDKEFAWAPAHPIADAYHAFRSGDYDFPSYDLAAALYAVHPDKDFFKVSESGDIALSDDGGMKFTPGSGKVKSLVFDPLKKDEIASNLREPGEREAGHSDAQSKASSSSGEEVANAPLRTPGMHFRTATGRSGTANPLPDVRSHEFWLSRGVANHLHVKNHL